MSCPGLLYLSLPNPWRGEDWAGGERDGERGRERVRGNATRRVVEERGGACSLLEVGGGVRLRAGRFAQREARHAAARGLTPTP